MKIFDDKFNLKIKIVKHFMQRHVSKLIVDEEKKKFFLSVT